MNKEEIKVLTAEIIRGAEQVIFGNLKIFVDEVATKLNTKEEILAGLSTWLDLSIKQGDKANEPTK